MSFGKSDQPKRRHRPLAEKPEVDPTEAKAEREDKMNSQMIPTALTAVAAVMLLGVAVMGAPYTYSSEAVYYSSGHIKESARMMKPGNEEDRKGADPKILIDFTTIIRPIGSANSEAMNEVAKTCARRAKRFTTITPDKVHRAFHTTSKYLVCAMTTNVTRFCDPAERQTLVEQLMDYKAKRQHVIGFEKYRVKAILRRENYRAEQLAAGASAPESLDYTTEVLPEELDPMVAAKLAALVKLGYFGPKDFGYYGFYVPTEFHAPLTVGADQYPHCPGKA